MKETCKREYPAEVGMAVIEQNILHLKQAGWNRKSVRTVMIVEFERETPDPPPAKSPPKRPFDENIRDLDDVVNHP